MLSVGLMVLLSKRSSEFDIVNLGNPFGRQQRLIIKAINDDETP